MARARAGARRAAALAGTVKMVMPLGPQVVYDVEIAGGTSIKISQSREIRRAHCSTSGSAIRVAPVSRRRPATSSTPTTP